MTPTAALSLALLPISALACEGFVRWMRRRAVGQHVRDVGPRTHTAKAGTPTMGGIVVLALWLLGVLLLRPWWSEVPRIAFPLAAGIAFGGIGLLDDGLSLRRRHSTGLGVLQKLGLTTVASVALFLLFRDVLATPLRVPFSSLSISLPQPATFVLTWFVFVGTTNSLNLADGLDGLAGGLAALILVGLTALAPMHTQLQLALPLLAVLLGFLWVNAHPASLFLGDVGSFGLGGILAAMALATGQALLLPIVAAVLVFEALSVMAQTLLFRLIGVRPFKMAPLHHHFEQGAAPEGRRSLLPGAEWPETRVTIRLLIVQSCFVAIALWAGGTW